LEKVIFKSQRKIQLLIFVFLFLFYFIIGSPHIANDGVYYYTLAEDSAINQSLNLRTDLPSVDEFEGKKTLKIKMKHNTPQNEWNESNPTPTTPGYPFLLSFIAVPFYYVGSALPIPVSKFVVFTVNPTIVAFTSVVIFSFGQHLFKSDRIGFVLAIFYGMTSFVVPWTSEFYTRPLVALMVISSIYFVFLAKENKNPFYALLGGIFTASIFLSQIASFILIFPILGYGIFLFRNSFRLIVPYFTGISFIVIIQLIINFLRFGKIWSVMGNPEGYLLTSTPWKFLSDIEGLYGLLFSSGWSIFLYFPLTVVFPISLYYLFKKDKPLTILFSLVFISLYLFSGFSTNWSGYGGWGPRYLIPVLPIITIASGIILQKFSKRITWKIVLIFLAISGFFVNLLGRIVWYLVGYSRYWEGLTSGELDGGELSWDPNYSPIVSHFHIATSDWTVIRWANAGPEVFGYGHFLNQIYRNCNFDLYLYCNFGLLPLVIIGIVMGVVIYFILRIMRDTNEKRLKHKPH